MSFRMASTYSVSSLTGLVSSKRRLTMPPYSAAKPKVHTDRLGMSNVQIAIGFWRKPCVHTTTVQPCFKVGIHDLLNEMTAAVAFFIPLSGRMRCG